MFGINKIQSQEKPFVVVLDAGHGGHDSGNRGNGYYEKNIALNIALKIGAQLEKISGLKVIYTRKKDVFVDLIKRAEIANKANADLFVSIHCDAFTSSKAFGAGTFVLGLHENERNFKVAQKAGVARTFQNIRLFPQMSVLENMMVAQHNKLMTASGFSILGLINSKSYLQKEKEAMEISKYWLDIIGLTNLSLIHI